MVKTPFLLLASYIVHDSRALAGNKNRLFQVPPRREIGSIDHFQQKLDTHPSECREILVNRRQRWLIKFGFGQSVETDNRNILRNFDSMLMERAKYPERHVIIGNGDSCELVSMLDDQLLRGFISASRTPVSRQTRSGFQALKSLDPTVQTRFCRPPFAGT